MDSDGNNCAKLFMFLVVCSKIEGGDLVIFGFMNSNYYDFYYIITL